MGLGHAGFGAVVDVVHQCVEKVQGGLAAIDVPRAFGVGQKNMVGASPALDVDVFAHLDAAVRAHHKQAAIAPGGQAIGGEPINPHIAPVLGCLQNHFTKVFKVWVCLLLMRMLLLEK